MPITTTTHINFRGEAKSALEFYQSVFGGEISLFTYTDAHSVEDPAETDWLSWGGLTGDNGINLMAYDVQVRRTYDPGERAFFVSVRATDADELTTYWSRLSVGATIIDDLGPAAWGTPLYGQLTDKFGVTWVLDLAVAY
jgi:PhnB protein